MCEGGHVFYALFAGDTLGGLKGTVICVLKQTGLATENRSGSAVAFYCPGVEANSGHIGGRRLFSGYY